MKKVLFTSTALVAFGLAGVAQAADPISLKLGGYSTWVFGYADQDDNAIGVGDRQNFDVKGTNEVFFLGSTTLDNGLKIGVTMELEAGGQGETTTDTIDEAFITVDGGFGRIILGSEDPASYLLHTSAPVAVGSLIGEGEVGDRRWIYAPTYLVAPGIFANAAGGVGTHMTTAAGSANGTDDNEKITYMTPNFSGFTAGISYTPSLQGAPLGDTPVTATETIVTDVISLGAAYNGSFSGVGLKLSAGYVTALDENGNNSPLGAAFAIDDLDIWTLGGQFAYAGFTVGASYKNVNQENVNGADFGLDGHIWDAGVMYATGPYAVSLTYQNSEAEGLAAIADENEKEVFLLSGKYNMGPGVDWIAGIGHVDYDVEGAGAATENDGWWAATGIALAF